MDQATGHAGRAGAAKHPNRLDNQGHERTPSPQVGPAARWSLDHPKLAYKDEVSRLLLLPSMFAFAL
jgi:hypothetical protein